MPAFMLYLLKANLVLVLFYLVYWFMLRKLTFYTYNRFYLLAALFLSAMLPLIDVTQLYAQSSQLSSGFILIIPDWGGGLTTVQQAQQHLVFEDVVLLIYTAGVIVLSLRFMLRLVSLWQMHQQSAPALWNGYKYRQLSESVSPFSFGRYIYLNPNLHYKDELQVLLLHEQVHAEQLHTLDVLVAELTVIFGWFNPTVWLLQRSIRQNLEYIADQQVLQQGVVPKSYQYSLVRVSYQAQSNTLAMSFNFNHIKNRIMMMNKQRSNPMQKLKYLFLPPAIAVLALMATTSRAEVELAAQGLSQSMTNATQGETSKVLTGATSSGFQQDSVVYFVDEKRMDAASLKNIDPKQIARIDVLKGEQAQDLVDDANVKGVIKITTKKAGEASTDDFSNKVEEAYTTEGIEGLGSMLSANPENVVYVLNGKKEISYEEVQRLSPDEIKAVSVAKDGPSPKMLQMYGERAKNGVVLIFTK